MAKNGSNDKIAYVSIRDLCRPAVFKRVREQPD
jgi:hypothetical protein